MIVGPLCHLVPSLLHAFPSLIFQPRRRRDRQSFGIVSNSAKALVLVTLTEVDGRSYLTLCLCLLQIGEAVFFLQLGNIAVSPVPRRYRVTLDLERTS